MEVILSIVVVALCYELVKRAMEQKAKDRANTLRLLEEALRHPHLDRQAVEGLAARLGDRRAGVGVLSALFLFVGWIGIFVAAGLLIAASTVTGEVLGSDLRLGGWITGLCAFGCLSYPFALRELEARRRA